MGRPDPNRKTSAKKQRIYQSSVCLPPISGCRRMWTPCIFFGTSYFYFKQAPIYYFIEAVPLFGFLCNLGKKSTAVLRFSLTLMIDSLIQLYLFIVVIWKKKQRMQCYVHFLIKSKSSYSPTNHLFFQSINSFLELSAHVNLREGGRIKRDK